jgi:AcrR family transcriptional regulator
MMLVMATRDSAATKQRILDAATAEFAEFGLAGARVDRIAARAGANKQLIYAYFGSKEGLFDNVLEANIALVLDAVPFTAGDSRHTPRPCSTSRSRIRSSPGSCAGTSSNALA